MISLGSQRKRERLEKLFKKQRGVCWWCDLPMILTRETKQVSATIDHLDPKHSGGGSFPERRTVAAHRLCNNHRGYASTINDTTRREIRTAVNKYYFSKAKKK